MRWWQLRGVLPLVVVPGLIGFASSITGGRSGYSQAPEQAPLTASSLGSSGSGEACALHAPQGLPPMPAGSTLIEREAYCLSANGDTKFADWVAYRLTKNDGFQAPSF